MQDLFETKINLRGLFSKTNLSIIYEKSPPWKKTLFFMLLILQLLLMRNETALRSKIFGTSLNFIQI